VKSVVIESWAIEHSGEGKTEARVSVKTDVGGVLKVDTYDVVLDKQAGEDGPAAIEEAAKLKLAEIGVI